MDESPTTAVGAVLTKDEADRMVVEVVSQHADALLRTARRWSSSHDDAQDAYQRALEIFVRRAATLDRNRVVGWVHTVIKHEALAVRAKRDDVHSVDTDYDREEAVHVPGPEERALAYERVTHTAEALQRLKPQEVQALWHKALGKSYDEIAAELRWTHTKVNRCLTEGRRALLDRFAGIESGAECDRWTPVLNAVVDGEAAAADLAAVRPHLRNCAGCRATVRELHAQTAAVAALLPPVAVAMPESPVHDAPGLLARVHETVATFVGEWAGVPALKLQAAVDALGGGKVAAVAASAAAVAGGGAVVAERGVADRPAASRAAVAAEPEASAPAPRLAPVGTALREARKVTRHVSGPAARPRAKGPAAEFGTRAGRPGRAAAEFAPRRSTAPAASTSTAEFRRPATAPVAAASAPAAVTRSPERVTASPRSADTGEFGF
ncbi:MAG TPA: sigma-70 family RNA polymerase sigma factor [Baekduia sp.]|nr:sigma-70 family RNA polymerase sigma factor [Baekduia sp.]